MGGVVATAGQFTKWYFGAYSMYPAGVDLGRGAGDSGAGLRVRTRLPLGPRARQFPWAPADVGKAGQGSVAVRESKAGSRGVTGVRPGGPWPGERCQQPRDQH